MSSLTYATELPEKAATETGLTGHLLLDHPLLNENSAFSELKRSDPIWRPPQPLRR
ncbi:MAG: hypothetical protein ACT4OT_08760 [Acidobacteriota bacterium]